MEINNLSVENFGELVLLNDRNESVKLFILWQDNQPYLFLSVILAECFAVSRWLNWQKILKVLLVKT